MFLPADAAALPIFNNAPTPIVSRALNLEWIVVTAVTIPFRLTFLAALLIPSKALEAPGKFNLVFNFSRVDKVVPTFASKFLLSKRISTTFSSIVLLISL